MLREPSKQSFYLNLLPVKGHFNICQLIIENVVEINSSENKHGNTPLAYAVQNDHYEICKLLVENLKDKSSVSTNGSSPLHYVTRG